MLRPKEGMGPTLVNFIQLQCKKSSNETKNYIKGYNKAFFVIHYFKFVFLCCCYHDLHNVKAIWLSFGCILNLHSRHTPLRLNQII